VLQSFHPGILALAPVTARIFDGSLWDVLATVADPEVDVERDALAALDALEVRRYVDRLPALERIVLTCRYGLGGSTWTCRELADHCGCSAGHIHAVERRAVDRLRAAYRRDGLLA
jgi:DNA-directed RNA polymerase specialized sigma24 family protein